MGDLDAYFTRVKELIAEHGWMVQGVMPSSDEPGFSYTVGAWEICGHEFVIFGVPPEIAQAVLNDLVARVQDGARPQAGDELHDLVRGYPVRLINVLDSSQYLTVANRLYGLSDEPLPALQLVFPDRDHRWPWQPGSGVAAMPLLGPVP